jgi:hypothetical protein
MSDKVTNETVIIRVSSPLLRPGLELEAQVSRPYAKGAVEGLLEIVRSINSTND